MQTKVPVRKRSSLKAKYKQSVLRIESKVIKCPKCEMTYASTSLNDVSMHDKYHNLHLRGRNWSSNWGIVVKDNVGNLPKSKRIPLSVQSTRSSKSNGSGNEYIAMIRPNATAEVKATLEIMGIVNNELNAPHDENDFWTDEKGQGRAFVYVKDNKAVAVVTMEILKPGRGRWMVYETKSIVDGMRPNFTLGISRIWVCRTQRANGIASMLLDVAREHTIYGKEVNKFLTAWSQPTESGGKLASKYNGVIHKSGKLLLPCYV
ncbi:Eco1p NDAI_0B04600 [Naumovozyma dairenensis CBS 421]|uniref:N-acetyltransferase ECO1 n=1 Tax=Naumovozyma dairenensis (strain ATCC 10597 / BCRC 20456 / CBS 421 / NBRC 0211 / NRRL Y-12639) TaxID=1071378 RepID=G0W6T4_NAUDC|nr:hypothetical protein NDAI_0B04600 [Naumovozyma dairenensis CBS 421]CCD23495.1 hypothetical protein NDAI_0B04600 [Naumovozyma dairenensis CBS 421]